MRALAAAFLVLSVATGAEAQYGETQYGSTGRSIGAVEAELSRLQALIAERTAERERVQAEIESNGDDTGARERLRTRARSLYRVTRAGMLPLAGGMTALLRHKSRIDRLRQLVAHDLEEARTADQRRTELRARVAEIDEELETQRRSAQDLEAERRTLEEEAARSNLFANAFDPSYGGSAYQAPSGYGTLSFSDEPSGAVRSFEAQRGHLAMPVAGTADAREGRREDGIGLEFLASPGISVRAVADGRVAFAERYASYGMLVVLDHGDGYFTVYGGLGSIHVRVGDFVPSGSGLGTVGVEGPTRGLYFEVRQGTRALDAPSWLGI
jgi:murein hydrolase activator